MNNSSYAFLVVIVCALITLIERFLPFIIFKGKEPPEVIKYVGRTLPFAIMALLVLYAYRNISFDAAENFVPQIIAGLVTAGVHLWRKNMILSIAVGTILYMVMVQLIF